MSEEDRNSQPTRHRRAQWWWMSAAIVVVLVAATAVFTAQLQSDTAAPGTTTASPTTTATTTTRTTAPPTTTEPAPAGQYRLLWPFADEKQAAAWQASYRTGGHQPWHLDAGLTAQSFTQGYLGYTTIDQVSATAISGADAQIGVGYKLPDGAMATAAVIHLIKVGSGQDAPWEVVGTQDVLDLTLTTPAYGSTVSSPMTVGGRITGVDESLRVKVLRLAEDKPVGQTSGIPAGGENTPWTAHVSFTAPAGVVLTVAVSTGGHINDVERFAITGVRSGASVNG